MLNYTSLFTDLDELYRGAGRNPLSYRRLLREVERAHEDLREYYAEVATDYVVRLQQRLRDPEALLTPEEATLIRAYLAIPPEDAQREQQLLGDLSRLEECLGGVQRLRGAPLNLRNLDALRRLLDEARTLLPRLVQELEERERCREFEEALGDGGPDMNRGWLLAQLAQALGEPGDASDEGLISSDELTP